MTIDLQPELTTALTAHARATTDLDLRFPVIVDVPVRWGDMDAFQHVNNTVYFRYFEIARIAYFERLAAGDFLGGTEVGPILADTSCRFRYPLTYPDTALTATRVINVGVNRIVMEHVIASRAAGRIAAQGTGTIVTFDYRAGQKVEVPAGILEAMRALEASVGRTIEG